MATPRVAAVDAGHAARMTPPTPCRPADDPRNGPLVLRPDLLGAGHSDRSIARLLRHGELVRVRPGAYVVPAVWQQLDAVGRFGLRGRAVLAQGRTTVALSHVSALVEHGAPMWGLDLSEVHVTRTDGLSGRHAAGVNQHVGAVRPEDTAVVNGVLVTVPARAALETLTLAPIEPVLCVVNDLLHRRLVTEADLRSQLVGMQWWPGMLAAEVLLRLADGRIESVGESRTFWLCYQQGLPAPVPQYEVHDHTGRVVARLDFAWPRLGVWLEFDGRVKYEEGLRPGERASDAVVREKRREELVARLTGWRCVRITWSDLERPAAVADLLRSAMRATA